MFDNEAPAEWRADLFALIKATPHLDWLILTKRIGNVRGMAPPDGLPANVWLGATIVNQEECDRDMHKLLAVPASVRFLSIEPMLGPIDLGYMREWQARNARLLDWVIVGGESGAGARPIQIGWVESVRRQCKFQGVAFFFKQWGGVTAAAGGCELAGAEFKEWPRAA